jgi:hypothetical protein
MVGSWFPPDHPSLTDDTCVVTSAVANRYNCIAWAAGDINRWWWPVPLRGIAYWPQGIAREVTMAAFIAAFATVGYEPCVDGSLEAGIEKVALYAIFQDGLLTPTHASRQLVTGEWTSKMGRLEDITHFACEHVNGRIYGSPRQFLSRIR